VLTEPVVARFYRTAPIGRAILERIFGPPKSIADPHSGARTVIRSTLLARATCWRSLWLQSSSDSPEWQRDSRANLWSPEVNCRHASEACGFNNLSDSPERQLDSRANHLSPEVNCRPPLGSQNCSTVDDSSVSDVLAEPVVARFYRTAPSGSAILERIFGPPKSIADPHWRARRAIL
jgi:hypothetical protein